MLFRNRKIEVRFLKDSEEHIRPASKESDMSQKEEKSKDVTVDKVVAGGAILIKTYFVWKMADRVLEKVLR